MIVFDWQVDAISKDTEDEFCSILHKHAVGILDSIESSDEHPIIELKAFVQQARTIGFSTEYGVAAFVMAAIIFGKEFNNNNDISAILSDKLGNYHLKAVMIQRVLSSYINDIKTGDVKR